jgi:hypothetical protein
MRCISAQCAQLAFTLIFSETVLNPFYDSVNAVQPTSLVVRLIVVVQLLVQGKSPVAAQMHSSANERRIDCCQP